MRFSHLLAALPLALLACSSAAPAAGGSDGDGAAPHTQDSPPMADSLAQARTHYQRAIADAYTQPLDAVKVQPAHAGLPDNPYDALKTGDLYAVRADWPGQDPGPAGFAAANGDLAYAKHPQGLQALIRAARVLDPDQALPTPDLVARVAWVYVGFGKPVEFHPAKGPLGPPTLPRADGGATLTYHALSTGNTGSTGVARIILTIRPDASTSIQRQPL